MLPNVLLSPSPDAHVPVLAREVGALLDVHPGELIVDCTFGAGGHARVLARDLEGDGQLVAIDRDPTTQPYVDALRATLGTGVQVRPMHGPFATCLRRLVDEGAQAGAVLMWGNRCALHLAVHDYGEQERLHYRTTVAEAVPTARGEEASCGITRIIVNVPFATCRPPWISTDGLLHEEVDGMKPEKSKFLVMQ